MATEKKAETDLKKEKRPPLPVRGKNNQFPFQKSSYWIGLIFILIVLGVVFYSLLFNG